MSKIFETSEDLANLGQSKFIETGLSDVGIRLKVLSLTKSNVCKGAESKCHNQFYLTWSD